MDLGTDPEPLPTSLSSNRAPAGPRGIEPKTLHLRFEPTNLFRLTVNMIAVHLSHGSSLFDRLVGDSEQLCRWGVMSVAVIHEAKANDARE